MPHHNISISAHSINQIPGIYFYKDRDSVFRGINTIGLHSIGFNKSEEVIGYSDSDLKPFEARADRYRKQDLHTLEGNQQLNIESLIDRSGKKVLHLIQKTPWLNEHQKIIGVLGFGFTLTRHHFKNLLRNFSAIHHELKDFFISHESEKPFIYGSFHFSYREAQVVSLMLKGYSIKMISKQLKLSSRTIEGYQENIRFKTSTQGKSEFITRAFETGFIELIFANFP